MPQWLAEYDGTIDIAAVQNTRCVYYPGAGFDGQPIHTFNGGNAAYLYIYADCIMEEIAKKSGVYPELLLVGTNCTEAWKGFWQTDAPGVLGGMYSEPRQLFCRSCWR